MFDAAAMQAKVDALSAAFQAREDARAATALARLAEDAADVAYDQAKAAVASCVGTCAGIGQYEL